MKVRILKGTTHCGKIVNEGDILDLDERDFALFVKINKDAAPYTEPVQVVVNESAPAAEVPVEVKKGKK